MRWIVAVLALTLVSGPAWAQTKEELDNQCAWGDSPNDRIIACTTLIQSDLTTDQEDLAVTYMDRAIAYELLGRRDEAIADYRMTMKLDPVLDETNALRRLGATPQQENQEATPQQGKK